MGTVKYKVPENWLRDYLAPRYPELLEPYREAAGITVSALQNGQLDDKDVAILLAYATSSKTVLAEGVGDMLGKLANVFPSAQSALESMLQSTKVAVRTQALASLLHVPPGPLQERLYSAALKDRSKKIRMLAARCILTQAMAALLPELSDAIKKEPDAETRQHLVRCHALLKEGYWLDEQNSETTRVTYCSRGSMSVRTFDSQRFEVEGKAWLAERASEWKKQWYLP